MDCAVGGDAARSRAENRPAAADLHRSREARLHSARAAGMKALLVLALLAQAAAAPVKFDSSRSWEHLRQLVSIGPRPAGSPAIEQTRKYIKAQLAASGRPV